MILPLVTVRFAPEKIALALTFKLLMVVLPVTIKFDPTLAFPVIYAFAVASRLAEVILPPVLMLPVVNTMFPDVVILAVDVMLPTVTFAAVTLPTTLVLPDMLGIAAYEPTVRLASRVRLPTFTYPES
jgi:hypothetical protein